MILLIDMTRLDVLGCSVKATRYAISGFLSFSGSLPKFGLLNARDSLSQNGFILACDSLVFVGLLRTIDSLL